MHLYFVHIIVKNKYTSHGPQIPAVTVPLHSESTILTLTFTNVIKGISGETKVHYLKEKTGKRRNHKSLTNLNIHSLDTLHLGKAQ